MGGKMGRLKVKKVKTKTKGRGGERIVKGSGGKTVRGLKRSFKRGGISSVLKSKGKKPRKGSG